MLTDINRRWLDEFNIKYGHAPRILHIGNIANNAYNNAKVLNEAGFDCDVICYDYYHIMACPEWEDAEIDGEISDQFQPDWTNVNLSGFIRPKWFAQGWRFDCIKYLIKKRSGKQGDLEWKYLEIAAHRIHPEFWFFLRESFRLFWRKVYLVFNRAFVLNLSPFQAFESLRSMRLLRPFGRHLSAVIAALAVIFIWPIAYLNNRATEKLIPDVDGTQSLERVIRLWDAAFPERGDVLSQADIKKYFPEIIEWKKLFGHYDVILAYSTDPIIPLLADVPYFAFEHGTLRDIPYKNDAEGRCTAIAYREAENVFVTNFDCLSSAEKLAPGKFTLINHPYDEDHGLAVSGYEELRRSLQSQLGSEHLFFFPTRQDWVPGTGYADKANDIFLRALGDLKRSGMSVGAVCCEWGSNIAQSKELVEREGLQDCILWVKPMANIRFERMAMACDVVVDQFKLGAFGGVLFKAMAVGSPILTYLNESRLLEQYSEVPPVINCMNREEIVEKMSVLFSRPEKLREIGVHSRMWIKKHHAKESTINLQVAQFRKFLTRH